MTKTVLIIEDDAITAHIYKTRLEKAGYQVEVATDGQSGFYRIHEVNPAAVLLDMMLPKMNGLDVLKKIRAQSAYVRMPVLVFTNAYVPNMVNEAMQAGASYIFNKSTLTPRQLLDTLRCAIEGLPVPTTNASPGATVTPKPSPSLPPSAAAPAPAITPVISDASGEAAPQAVSIEIDSADVLPQFLHGAPGKLTMLRKLHMDFNKAGTDEARSAILLEMYTQVHALTGGAALAGLYDLSQMAAALEVLLKEMREKPKSLTPSTIRTIALSLDFLSHLLRHDTQSDLLTSPTNILVVDDEVLSRRAITFALDKAQLKCQAVEDPQTALKMAEETTFDLIFLDVQMPGMDGYELCTQIRSLPTNQATPIVFVTSMGDFQSRVRSSLSGGTDFIAKPFSFIELTVKALVHILQRRLAKS